MSASQYQNGIVFKTPAIPFRAYTLTVAINTVSDMTVTEIRRRNAQLLKGEAGSTRALAEALGKEYSYCRNVLEGVKGIGHSVARQMEEKFGKAVGWMDIEHSDESKSKTPTKANIADDAASFKVSTAAARIAVAYDSDKDGGLRRLLDQTVDLWFSRETPRKRTKNEPNKNAQTRRRSGTTVQDPKPVRRSTRDS